MRDVISIQLLVLLKFLIFVCTSQLIFTLQGIRISVEIKWVLPCNNLMHGANMNIWSTEGKTMRNSYQSCLRALCWQQRSSGQIMWFYALHKLMLGRAQPWDRMTSNPIEKMCRFGNTHKCSARSEVEMCFTIDKHLSFYYYSLVQNVIKYHCWERLFVRLFAVFVKCTPRSEVGLVCICLFTYFIM